MSTNLNEQIFTFVAVRADGAAPVLHLAPCLSEAQARERAASWLATHPSCERVQIWSERELVGEVSLADAGRAQPALGR